MWKNLLISKEARLRVNNVIGQLQCPTWTNINSADPRTTPTQGFHEDHAYEKVISGNNDRE